MKQRNQARIHLSVTNITGSKPRTLRREKKKLSDRDRRRYGKRK
jgi:hypothetical protein